MACSLLEIKQAEGAQRQKTGGCNVWFGISIARMLCMASTGYATSRRRLEEENSCV